MRAKSARGQAHSDHVPDATEVADAISTMLRMTGETQLKLRMVYLVLSDYFEPKTHTSDVSRFITSLRPEPAARANPTKPKNGGNGQGTTH